MLVPLLTTTVQSSVCGVVVLCSTCHADMLLCIKPYYRTYSTHGASVLLHFFPRAFWRRAMMLGILAVTKLSLLRPRCPQSGPSIVAAMALKRNNMGVPSTSIRREVQRDCQGETAWPHIVHMHKAQSYSWAFQKRQDRRASQRPDLGVNKAVNRPSASHDRCLAHKSRYHRFKPRLSWIPGVNVLQSRDA